MKRSPSIIPALILFAVLAFLLSPSASEAGEWSGTVSAPLQSAHSTAAAWIDLSHLSEKEVDPSQLTVEVTSREVSPGKLPGGMQGTLRRAANGFHQLLWSVPAATREFPVGTRCEFDFTLRKSAAPTAPTPTLLENNLIGLGNFPDGNAAFKRWDHLKVRVVPMPEMGNTLVFDTDEDGNGPVFRAPSFSVGEGESYEISFCYQTRAAAAHPRYNLTFFSWLNFLDADGVQIGREMVASSDKGDTGAWVEVSRVFTAPPGTARAYLDLRNGSTVPESVMVAKIAIAPLSLPNAVLAHTGAKPRHLSRFDFGPPAAKPWGDFIAVSAKDRYLPERGWGFTRLQQPLTVDNLRPDDLGRDFISASDAEFRIDLPDGDYVSWFLFGDAAKSTDSVRRFFFNQLLEVNGEPVHTSDSRPSESIPALRLASYQHFWMPGMNYYDHFIAPRFQERTARVRVSGGRLRVRWRHLPLAAIMVQAAGEEEAFSSEIAKVRQARRRDARIVEVPHVAANPPLASTGQESERGFILFRKPSNERLYPNDIPVAAERIAALEAFAAKGQTESLWFSLHALKDGRALSVKVSDLKSGSDTLEASRIEVRVARYLFRNQDRRKTAAADYRYQIEAYPLDRQRKVPLVKGFNWTWCLEMQIPRETPAGSYHGLVSFVDEEGNALADLPLSVRVLPFELEPLPIMQGYYYQPDEPWYATFWGGNVFGARVADDPAIAELIRQTERRELAFMKSLGLNSVAMSDDLRGDLVYKDGEVSLAPDDRLSFWMELYKEAGMGPMPWYGFYPIGSATGSANRLSWLDASLKPPHTGQWFKAYRSLVKNVAAHAREQGWPEILFYISDERSNYGREGAEMGARLGRSLADVEGIRTIASMNGPAERIMVPTVDIAMPNFAFPLDDGIFDFMAENETELWLYNCGAQRVALGFWTWRMGVKGRFQWIYRTQSPDPWDDLAGRSPSQYSIAYPGPDGPVQTIASDTLRAAINDHRYVATLETWIDRRSNDPRFTGKVEAALEFLDYLRSRLPVDVRHLMRGKADAKEAGGDLEGEFASHDAVMRIRKAVAGLILDLQAPPSEQEGGS